jgi:hypothetical protein
MRSTSNRKAPPERNPIKAGIHDILPLSSVISMAGKRSDQKLAADHHPGSKPEHGI